MRRLYIDPTFVVHVDNADVGYSLLVFLLQLLCSMVGCFGCFHPCLVCALSTDPSVFEGNFCGSNLTALVPACCYLGHTKLIIFFTDPPTHFCHEQRKIMIVFVRERIKAGGEVLRLPVRSLVSGVNYHVATVKDDSFFRCRTCNNGLLVERASVYLLLP